MGEKQQIAKDVIGSVVHDELEVNWLRALTDDRDDNLARLTRQAVRDAGLIYTHTSSVEIGTWDVGDRTIRLGAVWVRDPETHEPRGCGYWASVDGGDELDTSRDNAAKVVDQGRLISLAEAGETLDKD